MTAAAVRVLPVPVAIRRPGLVPDTCTVYDEETAAHGSLGLMAGDQFMRTLLGRVGV